MLSAPVVGCIVLEAATVGVCPTKVRAAFGGNSWSPAPALTVGASPVIAMLPVVGCATEDAVTVGTCPFSERALVVGDAVK